jgi:hypothetical protein
MVGSSHRSEQRDDNHQPNDTMNANLTAVLRRQLFAAYDCFRVMGQDSENYLAYLHGDSKKLLSETWVAFGQGSDSLLSFAEKIRLA